MHNIGIFYPSNLNDTSCNIFQNWKANRFLPASYQCRCFNSSRSWPELWFTSSSNQYWVTVHYAYIIFCVQPPLSCERLVQDNPRRETTSLLFVSWMWTSLTVCLVSENVFHLARPPRDLSLIFSAAHVYLSGLPPPWFVACHRRRCISSSLPTLTEIKLFPLLIKTWCHTATLSNAPPVSLFLTHKHTHSHMP